MSNSINIIHLSDLHIDPTEEGDSRPVFKELCRKLEDYRLQRSTSFHLLIISGDLVNQGAGNYELVNEIVDKLLRASGLPKDRVFMVPGNHDIDWDKCAAVHGAFVVQWKVNPKSLDTADAPTKAYFKPGFAAYEDFATRFPLLQNSLFDLPGYTQADLNICDVPIRLCGLNSALIASSEDTTKKDYQLKDRLISLKILRSMLNVDERLHFIISHYPLSWIHEYERSEVAQRLQHTSAIYFHGHVHHPETDIRGIQPNAQLLTLGVGSLYGEKWKGRNHCQILEMNFNLPSPLLHELFWFPDYGWRKFEPIEISWGPWERLHKPIAIPEDSLLNKARKYERLGLVNIGKSRKNAERNAYFEEALDLAAEDSELIIVGRSLIDWSSISDDIEKAIRDKHLCVKLALLDENSIPCKSSRLDDAVNKSWIERPISKDRAIEDVPGSMGRFRRINIQRNTGSLHIYGLPFYSAHSFVAYMNKEDNQQYCLEEVGMAQDRERRPFLELKHVSHDSYAASLVHLYKSFMAEDRLVFFNDGTRKEIDTTQRSKIIFHKIKELGLVDLSVGYTKIDWLDSMKKVEDIIDQTPEDGEIFTVGRSLMSYMQHLALERLAEAIVNKGLKCIFVIANPLDSSLASLVRDDYAVPNLNAFWISIEKRFVPYLKSQIKHSQVARERMGFFELYGIPAYIPETFASYVSRDGIPYCSLEIGIGVTPSERPMLFFRNVSDGDIYSQLNKIYRSIMEGRVPLLRIPERP